MIVAHSDRVGVPHAGDPHDRTLRLAVLGDLVALGVQAEDRGPHAGPEFKEGRAPIIPDPHRVAPLPAN